MNSHEMKVLGLISLRYTNLWCVVFGTTVLATPGLDDHAHNRTLFSR